MALKLQEVANALWNWQVLGYPAYFPLWSLFYNRQAPTQLQLMLATCLFSTAYVKTSVEKCIVKSAYNLNTIFFYPLPSVIILKHFMYSYI